jgi:hypothetical protein
MTKWLERGLFYSPFHFCLLTDEKSFKKTIKKIDDDYGYPWLIDGATACVHYVDNGDIAVCIVTIDPWANQTQSYMHAVLAHEATHIWQHIRRSIGERFPSDEFEAYCIQSLTMRLIESYEEQIKPKTKTKKKK